MLRWVAAVVLAVVCASMAPATAGAYSGAFVPGSSFPTSWRARELLIRIACPPQTQSTPRPGDFSFCRGTIRVRRGARQVASAPFSIRTYDSHVERVRVAPGARGLFQPGRRVGLTWSISSHDGQGQWATRTGKVTLFNPYNRL